ncbi:SMC family ATPase, partial [Streptomyces sp. TRM76130]|nr:SMC family ATPase [Streptomyces sp. TRM76130]
ARAARLAEEAGAHRAARLRMDRARKAETVAPALELRDAADAEHRRARQAETRARALLPDGHAESGPAGLAAAARRAAEELGRLESARRAEQRLDALVAERAGLDRDERADDDLLAEAESWLAGWDDAREALRAAVESAQEAAARAEQLAERREPARRRLRAARQRDRLAGETDEARRAALASAERAAEARARWLDLK